MLKILFIVPLAWVTLLSFSQQRSAGLLLSDSSMLHASVSLFVAEAETGSIILDYNSGKSLIPASVLKLVTSAVALELLGPQYTFATSVGYTGSLNKRSGKLTGNIVIQGGGDPALGSKYFSEHYQDFQNNWVTEILKLGITRIDGRVLTDDSYFDFLPVPAKWLWEDAGNYYGAGVYGLSVFDNTYEIHLKATSDSSHMVISEIIPPEYRYKLSNWLVTAGTSDKGYVFAAPYSTSGWIAGTIPAGLEDFTLKASITDPPLLIAEMMHKRLEAAGIAVSEDPSTKRSYPDALSKEITQITVTISPPLFNIIEILNHESINLYAEHLLKELGKVYRNEGSTTAGIEVIMEFLQNAGTETDGMFIEDGSGLSPINAINSRELVNLLRYMKTMGKYYQYYLTSLPDAGKEGTLKYYFRDPVFDTVVKAKSGSMTRVRSFAGYFTTQSGKDMIFSMIVNNYTGPSKVIISGLEEIIKEIILNY